LKARTGFGAVLGRLQIPSVITSNLTPRLPSSGGSSAK
jgi:hypothetical protein